MNLYIIFFLEIIKSCQIAPVVLVPKSGWEMHITKWSSPNPLQDNTIGINGPFLDVVRSVEPSIYYIRTFWAFLDPIHPPYHHTSAVLCTGYRAVARSEYWVGVICPPGWDKVDLSTKIRNGGDGRGHMPPGPSACDRPGLIIMGL